MRGVIGNIDRRGMRARMRRHWRWLVVVALVVGLVAAVVTVGWYKLYRDVPARYFADEVENFKYGSIGTEAEAGIPFHVWKVLPQVCAKHVPGPGGYAAFGMIFEPGHDAPIGFSIKTIGFPRIGVNCGICHTGTVRDSADATPRLTLGGTAIQFDSQAYLRFLFSCAADPAFSAERILEEIDRSGGTLTTLDRLLYRHLIIPQTRRGLLAQRDGFAWTTTRPRWGRGRVEPFNPPKFGILGLPVDDTIGTTDIMALWRMTPGTGTHYHWDGLSTDLGEVERSSALGDGVTKDSIDLPNLARIQHWITHQPPPPYPYPIDQARAAAGEQIFETGCAECHAPSGKRFRAVIPVNEPGLVTDRHRIDMWTVAARDAYAKYADDTSWPFKHFHKTEGYVAIPLDGIWLRAPYLHNGSVPTLWQLLTPADRVATFYRGYDVFDPVQVGFVFQPPAERAEAERFLQRTSELDTALPGNGNQGHTYGAALSSDDKTALIEYMKTL